MLGIFFIAKKRGQKSRYFSIFPIFGDFWRWFRKPVPFFLHFSASCSEHPNFWKMSSKTGSSTPFPNLPLFLPKNGQNREKSAKKSEKKMCKKKTQLDFFLPFATKWCFLAKNGGQNRGRRGRDETKRQKTAFFWPKKTRFFQKIEFRKKVLKIMLRFFAIFCQKNFLLYPTDGFAKNRNGKNTRFLYTCFWGFFWPKNAKKHPFLDRTYPPLLFLGREKPKKCASEHKKKFFENKIPIWRR